MPLSDQSTLADILSEMYLYRSDLADVQAQLSGARLAEIKTLSDNLITRLEAVESRLTARETAHMSLVNQLNDIIQQLDKKIVDGIQLNAEIMPYDNALAAGYVDTTLGIKIRSDAAAQRKFTSQLLICVVAVLFAGAPSAMPVKIWDYDGATHTMPFYDYIALMIRLGQHVAAIESSY